MTSAEYPVQHKVAATWRLFTCINRLDSVHFGSTCTSWLMTGAAGQQRAVCISEAHLAALSTQDGVAHELLSVHLQLVGILQRTLHAHLLNPLLTRALPSAHNLTHNLPQLQTRGWERVTEGGSVSIRQSEERNIKTCKRKVYSEISC